MLTFGGGGAYLGHMLISNYTVPLVESGRLKSPHYSCCSSNNLQQEKPSLTITGPCNKKTSLRGLHPAKIGTRQLHDRDYSKTCVQWPLSKRSKNWFKDQLSLNTGKKYCRMLQGEHSAILLTFIKLPFDIKIFVISIFEWPFYKSFTVVRILKTYDMTRKATKIVEKDQQWYWSTCTD